MTRSGDMPTLRGPILVTGGTGFLGRELVRRIVESKSEAHVLARPNSERGPLATLPVTWHAGDLRDAVSIERAVQAVCSSGRDLGLPARVIHSAALISYKTRDKELAHEVNVEGTRRVVEAAKKHAVARVLFVSSVVAVGHSSHGEVLDESSPFNNARLGVDYVTTKRAAEEIALAASRELDVVIVNPGAIFGPVDRRSNTMRFIREMARGRAPRFAPPGTIGVVGVHDAAVGILLALERGRRGERYILVESSLPAIELFNTIARELGVRPVRWRVPRVLWAMLPALASVWDRFFPLDLAPPQALRMLALTLRFDASKARRELGWSPQPFDRVIAETVAHLQR